MSRRHPERTAASTSREHAPAAAARPRRRLTGRSVVLFVVLAVLLVSYGSSLRAWFQQRGHIQDLQAQIAADEQKVAQLKEEKQRWQDPAFVKARAHERFGWVLPGQIGYRVIGADGEPLGSTELADTPSGGSGSGEPWWSTAWGTVQAAGTTAEEREESRPATRIGPDSGQDGSGGGSGGDSAGDGSPGGAGGHG